MKISQMSKKFTKIIQKKIMLNFAIQQILLMNFKIIQKKNENNDEKYNIKILKKH